MLLEMPPIAILRELAIASRSVGTHYFLVRQEKENPMTHVLLSALVTVGSLAVYKSDDFQSPVRLTVGETAIRVESPGYAAPCWADVDGDGKKDLIVGQFKQGKMRVFKNLGAGKFAEGVWLKAGEKIAEVPGVW
jgi:hypothetical protein